MSSAPARYRWSVPEFLRAWEAGAFTERVELVDGEVWPVSIGRWHGATAARIVRALPNDRVEITQMSLAGAGSLPDPDCWVLRAGAQPVARLSPRIVEWSPADVLLVVEVADETAETDLSVKAALYGRAGFACYWVVTREGVYEHTGPTESGYRTRTVYRTGELVPVVYAGVSLAVDGLLAPAG